MVCFIPETSILLAGLEKGEFDVVYPIQPMEAPRLRENEEIQLQRYVYSTTGGWFNTKEGPFQSVELRRAVVMALDMEEIMLVVGKSPKNIELVASSFLKDSVWYTGEGEKCYQSERYRRCQEINARSWL